jgi:hypothetical protein
LDLKWQKELRDLFNFVLRFSKEGSRIAVYSPYKRYLALFNSIDGSFVAGNKKDGFYDGSLATLSK